MSLSAEDQAASKLRGSQITLETRQFKRFDLRQLDQHGRLRPLVMKASPDDISSVLIAACVMGSVAPILAVAAGRCVLS